MNYHQGRLIDHIHLHVADLERSRQFYQAILAALGKANDFGGDERCFYSDELYVDAESRPTTNLHLAFQAGSKASVEAFHRAGTQAGGIDNGAPGFRNYHDGYYAAFLLDPDGNNIEAIWDAGASRSADSVIVTRTKSGDA